MLILLKLILHNTVSGTLHINSRDKCINLYMWIIDRHNYLVKRCLFESAFLFRISINFIDDALRWTNINDIIIEL